MIKNEVFSIGVMSGTSLDGIDLVYCSFCSDDFTKFEIMSSKTVSYSTKWKSILQRAIQFSKVDLQKLHVDYGRFLGETINEFIRNNKIVEIDFIASHGHTILHQPENRITLQIGCGKEIAKITNQKVIFDFRTQDVMLGGQGAPLVPIGDELLFSSYDYCINLGGFSNVSFKSNGVRIAYDICPVNIVLNHYARKLGLEYDASGEIASQGKINQLLLKKLNEFQFYKKEPPKSLGLEWVQQHIFPLIDAYESDVSIVLRTFVEHIAIQVGKVVLEDFKILITGGGAFNTFLISRIEFYSCSKINLPSVNLINFKEALIFAFLGLLRINNQINCLKSVTGASKDHSSGVVEIP